MLRYEEMKAGLSDARHPTDVSCEEITGEESFSNKAYAGSQEGRLGQWSACLGMR